nr:O-acyltransferase WSD1-like [Ipomoea batatas]
MDLHLLNLKTSDAEAVGVLRIHHSLGDGASLISLLLACTRQTAHPHNLPTIPTKKRRPPAASSTSTTKMWPPACFVSVWCFLTLMWNSLVDVFMFVATALFFKDTNTPIKAMPASHFNPRRVVYRTVSLDDFKLIKNAMNMELGEMMEKESEAKWGNCIGYVILPFRIELKENPLDYLKDAKSTIDRKKRSLEALYTSYIAQFVLKLLGIKALMINFQSYINKMTMVLSVDENVIPNPHQLLDDLEMSLKLIKDATLAN